MQRLRTQCLPADLLIFTVRALAFVPRDRVRSALSIFAVISARSRSTVVLLCRRCRCSCRLLQRSFNGSLRFAREQPRKLNTGASAGSTLAVVMRP